MAICTQVFVERPRVFAQTLLLLIRSLIFLFCLEFDAPLSNEMMTPFGNSIAYKLS